MRRWLALAVVALLAAGAARAETFTDSAGRTVELPAQVIKVLAAGPPASVMLYTLVPEKLMGWTRAPDAEALAYLPARFRGLKAQMRLTGHTPADPAAVKALGANLIVDFGTVNPSYAEIADRTQAATGTPYVLVDGAIAKTAMAYAALGKAVQAAARGEMLAAKSAALLDDMKARLAGAAPKRVYVARGPDGNESYGAGSFTDEMLGATGAVNVAADWGRGNLKDIAPDKVREVNPDVVIVTDPYFLEVIAKTPAWKQVPAIAAGRIYVAPRYPWGWLDEPPSVNRLIGVRWLAGVLHPDRFAADPRAEVRDFFKVFYQSDLTAAQLDALLAGAGPAKR
jgi:iron complex transport system substrate-binding protein